MSLVLMCYHFILSFRFTGMACCYILRKQCSRKILFALTIVTMFFLVLHTWEDKNLKQQNVHSQSEGSQQRIGFGMGQSKYANVLLNKNAHGANMDGHIKEHKEEKVMNRFPQFNQIIERLKIINALRQKIMNVNKNKQSEFESDSTGDAYGNQSLPVANPVKVLLLAYPRSGSSFVGTLISAPSTSAYFFEPLRRYRNVYNKRNARFTSRVKVFVNGLLNCKKTILKRVIRYSKNRRVKKCLSSSPRVVKTIRLHQDKLLPWILLTKDIKVVHLVRDPRAILSSMKRFRKAWKGWLEDYGILCRRMEADLALQKLFPSSRYIRIKYEDVVVKPITVMKKIYKFLGVPFNSDVNRTIFRHTHAEHPHPKAVKKNLYYSTFRERNFKFDSWKKKLSQKAIVTIENKCASLMTKLKYEKHTPGA